MASRRRVRVRRYPASGRGDAPTALNEAAASSLAILTAMRDLALAVLVLASACGREPDTGLSTGPGITLVSLSSSSTGEMASASSSTSGASDSSAGVAASSSDAVPDMGLISDFGPPLPPGCKGKIDFLFLIARNGTISSEQAQLIASLPGFIATIEATFPTTRTATGRPVTRTPVSPPPTGPASPEGPAPRTISSALRSGPSTAITITLSTLVTAMPTARGRPQTRQCMSSLPRPALHAQLRGRRAVCTGHGMRRRHLRVARVRRRSLTSAAP